MPEKDCANCEALIKQHAKREECLLHALAEERRNVDRLEQQLSAIRINIDLLRKKS